MISAILASLFVRKVDVVIGTSPQFFTACAACAAAALRRRPWVFELRDLWPEAIRAVGAIRSDLLYRMIETVELFLYRNADLIVAVSHAFRGNLISRGIPGGKVRIITNGVDLARFRLAPKDEELLTRHGLQGKFVVGYIGTHGMSHALQTVVEACALLMDRPDARDIHILMIGDGAEKRALSAEARRRKLENISFIDTVPKADVVRYWTLLDASIVHLKDVDVHRTVIPSKIFESMAMGVAILHGAKGESEAIILDNGAGITFEQENPSDLAKKILELSHSPQSVRTMSSNGVSAATQYDRDTLAQRMLEEIVSLSERRARARLAATSG
jgi:glycosyltransferase involved in cell wall biosynthesis